MTDASHYTGGHARIIAGPGTGKTSWIVRRAADLITEGADASRILLLTFSVATARELRQRLADPDLGMSVKPDAKTLHAYSFQQLRRTTGDAFVGPIVMDEWEERQVLCEDLGHRLGMSGAKVSAWLDAYDAAWRTLEDPPVEAQKAMFQAHLETLRAIFGFALIGESVYQFKRFMDGDPSYRPQLEHLLVDEYQDLNPCDLQVIRDIVGRAGCETVVVGDDDQSIYGFRHADPEGLHRFLEKYELAGHFELTTCYRCPDKVLSSALRLIAHNERRLPKTIIADRAGGRVVVYACRSPEHQYRTVAGIIQDELSAEPSLRHSDVLVLVPRRSLAEGYAKYLKDANIPAVNLAAVDETLATDAFRRLFYLLRIANNADDQVALRGWLRCVPGVGVGTVAKVIRQAETAQALFRDACQNAKEPRIVRAMETLRMEVDSLSSPGAISGQVASVAEAVELSEEGRQVLERMAKAITDDWNLNASDGGAPIIEQAEEAAAGEVEAASVSIMTMRKAKGLGARLVIVAEAEEALIPGPATDVPEQRRLMYVSATRARERLYFTHVAGRRYSGKARYAGAGHRNPGSYRQRSRFLDEMGILSTKAPW